MPLDPTCSMTCRCWEWYQGETKRVTRGDIENAVRQVQHLAQGLTYDGGREEMYLRLHLIREHINHAISLDGDMWRDMVRQPFDFPWREAPSQRHTAAKPQPTLDDLML